MAWIISGQSLAMVGCGLQSSANTDTSKLTTTDLSRAPVPENIAFDCGVVTPGQTSVICFPASRLGINSTSEVESIETSCECVQAELIEYFVATTRASVGIRLTITEETEQTPSNVSAPIELRVPITIRLHDGKLVGCNAHYLSAISREGNAASINSSSEQPE